MYSLLNCSLSRFRLCAGVYGLSFSSASTNRTARTAHCAMGLYSRCRIAPDSGARSRAGTGSESEYSRCTVALPYKPIRPPLRCFYWLSLPFSGYCSSLSPKRAAAIDKIHLDVRAFGHANQADTFCFGPPKGLLLAFPSPSAHGRTET